MALVRTLLVRRQLSLRLSIPHKSRCIDASRGGRGYRPAACMYRRRLVTVLLARSSFELSILDVWFARCRSRYRPST